MALRSDMKNDLRQIFTPELLRKVYKMHIPMQKGELPDWEQLGSGPSKGTERNMYQTTFPNVLLPLSKMPLEELRVVDLREFLPPTDAPEYPEQCLAMIHILDQARVLLHGTDLRYVNDFFDVLAFKLAKDCLEVRPPPHSKEAWLSRGWTFENWVAVLLGFLAPLIHSESFMVHQRPLTKELIHEYRSEVERYTGVEDPFAAREGEDERDLFLFSKLILLGSPTREQLGREVRVEDYAFYWIRMLNAHYGITDRFGRYPYRNDVLGRDFAAGELEWMKETGVFERLPEDVRDQIRRDVDSGIWSPLKGNSALE